MTDNEELMRLADEMHKASPAGTDVPWKTLRRFSDNLRSLARGAATLVEVIAKIISGAPSPSARSYAKAREIAGIALAALAPQPKDAT